jgi:hypothetical protein
MSDREKALREALKEAIDGFEEHVQFVKGSLMHVTVQKWKRIAFDEAATPPVEPAAEPVASWVLDESEATLLRDTIGHDGDCPSITLGVGPGGGLYVWLTEYPEEGSILLTEAQAEPAAPAPEPLTDERTAFEQWAFDRGWRNFTRDEHSGAYLVEGDLELRWIGWRARAALTSNEGDAPELSMSMFASKEDYQRALRDQTGAVAQAVQRPAGEDRD